MLMVCAYLESYTKNLNAKVLLDDYNTYENQNKKVFKKFTYGKKVISKHPFETSVA